MKGKPVLREADSPLKKLIRAEALMNVDILMFYFKLGMAGDHSLLVDYIT